MELAQKFRRKLTFSLDQDLTIKLNVTRLTSLQCLELLKKFTEISFLFLIESSVIMIVMIGQNDK